MNHRMPLGLALATATLLGLSACGGDDASPTTATTTTTFSGTAATGAAMAGATVSISCASGSGTTTTATNGSYTKDLISVTLPCALKAASSDGTTVLYSVTTATATGSSTQVANITPLTQLLVASLAGTDPGTFFTNFSAYTSSVTASSVSTAQTAVLTTLANAGLDVSSLSNLLTGTLVAATSTTTGNAYDAVLDALKTQLTSSGTTLATLITTVAAASPVVTTSTTGTSSNLASLPAAQLLKTADSNCAALRSGDYWAITPTLGAGISKQFTSASYNASNKTATNLVGALTVFSDSGSCKYLAADGVSNIVVSQAGVVAARYLDSNNASRLGLAIPKQSIAVAELAGTWNVLDFEMNGAGTGYSGSMWSATVNNAGAMVSGTACDSALLAANCSAVPAANLGTFSSNADGGFNVSNSGDPSVSRAFAYRAGNGDLMAVMVDGDGSVYLFTKMRTLSLPTVGDINPKSWSIRTRTTLLADALLTNFTTTVMQVDTTTGGVTRTQNLEAGTPNYTETVVQNSPRAGYSYRAAATTTDANNNPVSIRERTSMGLRGMGISVQSVPSQTAFQVTVDQQP